MHGGEQHGKEAEGQIKPSGYKGRTRLLNERSHRPTTQNHNAKLGEADGEIDFRRTGGPVPTDERASSGGKKGAAKVSRTGKIKSTADCHYPHQPRRTK